MPDVTENHAGRLPVHEQAFTRWPYFPRNHHHLALRPRMPASIVSAVTTELTLVVTACRLHHGNAGCPIPSREALRAGRLRRTCREAQRRSGRSPQQDAAEGSIGPCVAPKRSVGDGGLTRSGGRQRSTGSDERAITGVWLVHRPAVLTERNGLPSFFCATSQREGFRDALRVFFVPWE